MARLLPGENQKIDDINRYVKMVQYGTKEEAEEGMCNLLTLFKPLLLKLCSKWSNHFNDNAHKLIPFDEIMVDAEMWMWKYTKEKYVENGSATYNTFIRSHMDQRIRYIYEVALNTYKNVIFPDPDKNDPESDVNIFDTVLSKYSNNPTFDNVEDHVFDAESEEKISEVCKLILLVANDERYLNQREQKIFNMYFVEKITHTVIAKEIGVSRVRIAHVCDKIRAKVMDALDENHLNWWDDIGYNQRQWRDKKSC